MTWKDEDIDKLFQEASKEKTFEFKEEYWDEMESMLPKKKRKFPFIWIFSSILMSVSIAAVLFMNIGEKLQIREVSFSSKSKANEKSNISVTTKTSKEVISGKEENLKIMTQNCSSPTMQKTLPSNISEVIPASFDGNISSKNIIFNSGKNTFIDYTKLHGNDNSFDSPEIIKAGIESQANETKNSIVEQKKI
jgi:hypothetical protein